jgi:hypothetical protein
MGGSTPKASAVSITTVLGIPARPSGILAINVATVRTFARS